MSKRGAGWTPLTLAAATSGRTDQSTGALEFELLKLRRPGAMVRMEARRRSLLDRRYVSARTCGSSLGALGAGFQWLVADVSSH